jgi:arylsulfatase A-like enzyme
MSDSTVSRRSFLEKMRNGAAAAALASVAGCGKSLPAKPNVVLIMVDDLGYGDLGSWGQKEIQTPNIDRMATQGMRFTDHYAGSTVCAPSRCCLMTGVHTGHARVRGNTNVLMEPQDYTLGKLFKDAGYTTGCIGKWGIGHPPPPNDPQKNGFDHFFGYLSMWHAHNFYTDFLWRNGEKVPLKNIVQHPETHYKEDQRELVGISTNKVEYSHDLFANEALQFIEDNKDQPFFLYLPFTIPHANNEAGDKGMEVPNHGIYANKDWPEPQKGHAAMISRMDKDVGRIEDKLKELGLTENTLVIFTSDNGPHKEGGADPAFNDSNGPLRGMKRDLYEGGIRVPMIAKWPGVIDAGSNSDHVSAFWDYMPTFAELIGWNAPAETDGISLLPTLTGSGRQQQHDNLYWEFHERGVKQAVRMGKWKGVRLGVDSKPELYDLSVDIGETNNVAAQHPDIVAEIVKRIESEHADHPEFPI